MLIQEEMIARVRQICCEDRNVVAAMMYGSFTKGEGDSHSDIEFNIYVDDAAYDSFEPIAWISQVAPVALYVVNEFGTGTAIFDNLVRGEFHFERATDMIKLRDLRQLGGFGEPRAMLIHDQRGELLTHLRHICGPDPDRSTRENITWLWHNYLNWMLFGASVLARGERARALEILWYVHRYLLWFVRLDEGTVEHWLTPSKNAERDLSKRAYDRYVTCTATLVGCELERAYRGAWAWGKELACALADKHGVNLADALVKKLDAHFVMIFGVE